MKSFGNLKKIGLRKIWANEASNFTPWLADNIQALGEALGMELELLEKEASVGDFSLDLLAKNLSNNKTVIIENQLTQTDHDHLGKLLTYASGFDASVVIWIAEKIRDEHKQALDWLNHHSDDETGFFGVTVDVFQIDDSNPAYVFNPIVFPSEWQKSKGGSKKKITPKGEAYLNYYQELIDILREKHRFTGAKKAQPQNWYAFSTGVSGLVYSAVFSQKDVRVELYIDRGDFDENKKIFDWLEESKDKIETDLGFSLTWERLDDKRASRVYVPNNGSINDKESRLNELREWQISNLLKFKKVFGPFIQEFRNG
ncbi:MAG: DUF4268 domain-containing protein [Candidatus Marinimicrobia bacterium]|nr:DUF4268 domain-containing protein [Candidatus Neomarinimicrobiota bacterium]